MNVKWFIDLELNGSAQYWTEFESTCGLSIGKAFISGRLVH